MTAQAGLLSELGRHASHQATKAPDFCGLWAHRDLCQDWLPKEVVAASLQKHQERPFASPVTSNSHLSMPEISWWIRPFVP